MLYVYRPKPRPLCYVSSLSAVSSSDVTSRVERRDLPAGGCLGWSHFLKQPWHYIHGYRQTPPCAAGLAATPRGYCSVERCISRVEVTERGWGTPSWEKWLGIHPQDGNLGPDKSFSADRSVKWLHLARDQFVGRAPHHAACQERNPAPPMLPDFCRSRAMTPEGGI